jgi:alkaline phosphatase D
MNTFDTSTPFRHGVASGDPLPDSVIIWTRVSTRLHQPIEVTWTMACDSEFSEVVATGTVETSVDADYTVKADVRGLKPDHTYFADRPHARTSRRRGQSFAFCSSVLRQI